MSKKHKCKKCPECEAGEKWAVPTADFFSLLLALFIALFAIASVNKEKLKSLKEEFVKIYDYTPLAERVNPVKEMVPDSQTSDPDNSGNPIKKSIIKESNTPPMGEKDTQIIQETLQDSITKIQQEIDKASMTKESSLDQSMDGVLLKLPASILFKGVNTTIDDEDIDLFIKRMAMIIETLPKNVAVSVRGYSDDLPLAKDLPYKDHIELSIKRAQRVASELIRYGVDKNRLSVAGFGSSNPIIQNTSEENRAKNRRVEFYIFISNSNKLDQKEQETILDLLKNLKK